MSSPFTQEEHDPNEDQQDEAVGTAEDQLFERAFHHLPEVHELEGYAADTVAGRSADLMIDPSIQTQHMDDDEVDEDDRMSRSTRAGPSTANEATTKEQASINGGHQLVSKRKVGEGSQMPTAADPDGDQVTTCGSSTPTQQSVAQSSKTTGTSAKYSNKEQLAILRHFYLENPTPSKSQIIELADMTGRHWSKVKEYFRQRRNKLRGLHEAGLDDMEEPDRATSWLQMSYRPVATATVSQLDVYLAYQSRFDPYHKVSPLLGGQDLIRLACATFGNCSLARDEEGEWIMRGLGEKAESPVEEDDGHASDVRGTQSRNIFGLEEYLVGMPEPLRASTWLMHNYRAAQMGVSDNVSDSHSTRKPSISQTELYASYIARFGSETEAENRGSRSPKSSSDLALEAQEPTIRVASSEPTSPRVKTKDADTANNRKEQPPLRGKRPKAAKGTIAQQSTTRLLNPLELINLTKMTFPGAEAKIDDQGRFIIKGVDRREGVGKYKTPAADRSNDVFPFGLLHVDPSSANHPFTSVIKRKLDVLEKQADSQDRRKKIRTNSPEPPTAEDMTAHPSDEPGHSQPLITADELEAIARTSREQDAGFEETLPAADRELVEGLRRFKDSRLGKETRDVCVQQ